MGSGGVTRRGFVLAGAALAADAVRSPAVRAQRRGADGQSRPTPRKRTRTRTREEVKYQNAPFLGRTCARCVFYQGHGVCVILEGAVSPNGWCTQWAPNTVG